MGYGFYFHIGKKLDEDNVSNACFDRIIEIYDTTSTSGDENVHHEIAKNLIANYDLSFLMQNVVTVYYVRYSKPQPNCGIKHIVRYFGTECKYEAISTIGHSINCEIERCIGSFIDFCKEFNIVVPKIEFACRFPSSTNIEYTVYSTVDEIVENHFDEYNKSWRLDLNTMHHLFSRAMQLHVFKITYNAVCDKIDKTVVCCPIEVKDMGTLFDWIFKHYNHSGLIEGIIKAVNKELGE